MTTRVTVEPAGHDIEVITTRYGNGGEIKREFLAPNDAPRMYYVYDDIILTVREVKLVVATGSVVIEKGGI